MIFKASTRGMGVDYAKYLLHNKKNEQVRVLDIQGTASPQNAYDSLIEIGAYQRLTRSEKPFVQIVINPADDHEMTDQKFLECIDVIGQKTGLSNQPMVAVIHTYKGKEHMHLTYGRYDHATETMLPVDQIGLKLKEALLEIELKQGHEHLLNWKEKQSQKEAEQQLLAELETKRQETERQRLADEEKRRQVDKMTQFALNSIDLDQKKQEMAARFARSHKKAEEQQEDEQRLKI